MRLFKKAIVLFTATAYTCAAVGAPISWKFWKKKEQPCEELVVNVEMPQQLEASANISGTQALQILHDSILLHAGEGDPWLQVLDDYLWSFIRSESRQLAVSIIGPSNVGKSTLFNAIPKLYSSGLTEGVHPASEQTPFEISKVGHSADETKRPVLMMHTQVANRNTMVKRFGPLDYLFNPSESAIPGRPLMYSTEGTYPNLIMIDTPSLDVHERIETMNKAIVWSDIVFYVFASTQYKSDLNLDVLKKRIEGIGPRQIVLVYRVRESVPRDLAEKHVREVANSLYPASVLDPLTGMPPGILASYIMVDSSAVASQHKLPELIPINQSPPFNALLEDLNDRFRYWRRLALENSLDFVLDGVSSRLKREQKIDEEIKLTVDSYDLFLTEAANRVVGVFPYHRMSSEVESAWFAQTYGVRNLSRWFQNPIAQLRGKRVELPIKTEALAELEQYMGSVIDRTVSDFLLAAKQGMFRISPNNPNFRRFEKALEEFRIAHNIPENVPPYVRYVSVDQVEVYVSRSPQITEILDRYVAQDWEAIKTDVKRETQENLHNLTLQIRNEVDQVVKEEIKRNNILVRGWRNTYPVLAVAPLISIFLMIAWSPNVAITDPEALVSVFVGWLAAKFFVRLDEGGLKKAWGRIIDEWYKIRQHPRLNEILQRRMRLRPLTSTADRQSMDQLQAAIERLSLRPVELLRSAPDQDILPPPNGYPGELPGEEEK